MIILLPKTIDGISEAEKIIFENKFIEIEKRLKIQEVSFFFPEFKISKRYNLNQSLSKLGLTDLFSGNANLSGMTEHSTLSVGCIVHQAVIEVNEKGTEAVAATAVTMSIKSERPGIVFKADHPFVFFIRDNYTNTILFVGKIINPAI